MSEITVRELFPAVAAYADVEAHLNAEVAAEKDRLVAEYTAGVSKEAVYSRSLAIWGPREVKKTDTKASMIADLADYDANNSAVGKELLALHNAAHEQVEPLLLAYYEMRSTSESLARAARRLVEDTQSMLTNLEKGWFHEPNVSTDGVSVDKHAMLLRFQWDTARGLVKGHQVLTELLQRAVKGESGGLSLPTIIKVHRSEQQAAAEAAATLVTR